MQWRRQQLTALALASLGVVWFAIWGPPSGFEELDRTWPLLATMVVAIWIACQITFLVRRFSARRPVVRTQLGTVTMGLGISAAAVCTVLLGGLAVFLAPAGLITGTIVLIREIRSRSGNDVRNLLGIALCVGAIVFLLA